MERVERPALREGSDPAEGEGEWRVKSTRGCQGDCHDSGSSVNTITVWGVTSPDITRVDNDITPVMTAGAQ